MRLVLPGLAAVLFVCAEAAAEPRLSAATAPNARAVELGDTATIFATIINSGDQDATGCIVRLDEHGAARATLDWQRTDASNIAIGAPNEPFTVPAGGSQTLVLGFTPTTTLFGTHLAVEYVCDEAAAPSVTGTNDIHLRAAPSGTAVADVIMILQTLSGDGVVRISENGRRGVAAGALVNIGAAADILLDGVLPIGRYTNALGPLDALAEQVLVCLTNASGQCLEEPAWGVSIDGLGPDPVTFNVYVYDHLEGAIPFWPEFIRLGARVMQRGDGSDGWEDGVSGVTSVAVVEPGPDVSSETAYGRWWGYHGDPSGNHDRFQLFLTSAGHFVLRTAGPPHNPPLSEVLFGHVTTSQAGGETALHGEVSRISDGDLTEPVPVDGFLLTPRGRLRGTAPVFGGDRVRGYFNARQPDSPLDPMTQQQYPWNPSEYDSIYYAGVQLTGGGLVTLVPDLAQPGRMTGDYRYTYEPGVGARCDAELLLTHQAGDPAPQAFDAVIEISACDGDPRGVELEGVYGGWGLVAYWRPSHEDGNPVQACYYYVFTNRNPDDQPLHFHLQSLDDSSFSPGPEIPCYFGQ